MKGHPAIALDELWSWYGKLKMREGIAARALQFLTLTAARSGEVRGARWEEMDLKSATWSIPAERMKGGREHRVPLTEQAVSVLEAMPRLCGSPYVFPSAKGKALSDMTISAVMRRMQVDECKAGREGFLDARSGRPAVPHGIRSTFRDWAAERTEFPREMAEMALAHFIGSEVERAYLRGDMIARRRKMMEQWAAFVSGTA